MSDVVSRRAFLAAAGAAGSVWLLADPELVHAALAHARKAVASRSPQFAALTAAQAAGIEAIAMRIFPTDDTPGAREAGVIHFIDKSLTTFAAPQKDLLLAGLAALNQQAARKWPGTPSFAALQPDQQDELLKSIETEPFFGSLRFATIVGMLGSPSLGGNRNQVGWKLIGFEGHGIFQPPFGFYDAEAAKGR